MPNKTAFRILAPIAATAILGGCGSNLDNPNRPPTREDIAHAEDMMRQLPSVEASEHELATVIQEITVAAKNIAPELDWHIDRNRGQNTIGCPSPYLKADGVSMTTDRSVSSIPIPDHAWTTIFESARGIATQHGMTSATVRADIPGRHDVLLHSPDNGDEIKLITAEAALVKGTTGCRFRADAPQRSGK